jgi:hypothetical protein
MPGKSDPTDPVELSNEVMKRNQLQVTNIDSQPIEDASVWWNAVKADYRPLNAPAKADDDEAQAKAAATQTDAGPTGKAVIVQIAGHHYHNAQGNHLEGAQFVREVLLTKLAGEAMQKLGVSYPVLLGRPKIYLEEIPIPAPKVHEKEGGAQAAAGFGFNPPGGLGGLGMGAAPAAASGEKLVLSRFDFRVQFIWQYKSPTERAAAAKALAEGKTEAGGNAATPIGGTQNKTPAGGAVRTPGSR